ncbi:MAG: hypothetical protein B6244_04260 [Candidatus Cloacimonetes bacterium 4572_55]|nr:MAG: hypothetical protein B6244_04260 [Candidatus Cloacimonetes bacterium 4572_55]
MPDSFFTLQKKYYRRNITKDNTKKFNFLAGKFIKTFAENRVIADRRRYYVAIIMSATVYLSYWAAEADAFDQSPLSRVRPHRQCYSVGGLIS